MSLRYVYGIAPAAAAPAIESAGLAGIDASRVRAIAERELAAVASDLPEDEWRDDVLNERIRDLEWLTPRAASHQEVNARAMEIASALIPLSFGTLFKTEKDIVEFLEDTYGALRDVLQKMKDKLEFGLKVNWDRDQVLADVEQEYEEIRRLKAQIEGDQASSTYFARMQLGRLVEQALAQKSEGFVREIYDELRDSAIASRSNKVIGDRMIMNAAFLVDRSHAEAFDQKVQEIGRRYEGKLKFTYTGPWPPYNFVTIRLQLERSAGV